MKKLHIKFLLIGLAIFAIPLIRGTSDTLLLLGLLLIIIGIILLLISIARKKEFKKLAIILIIAVFLCLPFFPSKSRLNFYQEGICQYTPTDKKCADHINRSLVFLLLEQVSLVSNRNSARGELHML